MERDIEILKRKVAEGVDVRVMYDDVGCFYTLPTNYDRTLEARGIPLSGVQPLPAGGIPAAQ